MTDDIHTIRTDPTGRKRGGRKAGLPESEGAVAASVPELDQALTAEEGLQGSAQAIAPVPFDFQGKAVRTIAKGDDIWFVAMDACALLEHSNPRMAIGSLDDDQKGVSIISTAGGPQRANVVSESGLFTLIFTSRKPEAKAFRRWVTGVVLPTLRRSGQFDMTGEPSQGSPARDEIDGRARNGIAVPLPGPGRYLVVLFHDGERRIEPLCFSDAVSALATLDCRSIAYLNRPGFAGGCLV
jgi:prophage antirepressor-like protein